MMDYFTDCSNIVVKNVFEWGLLCRAERRFRKMVLRQRDAGCPTLAGLHQLLAAKGAGPQATVEARGVRRQLILRPGTTDASVAHYVFKEWALNLASLARWAEIQAFLKSQHELGRRPLIIDAGANNGATSIFFALAFPTALIVAIEPEEGNFEALNANTKGLNVKCLKAALSSVNRRIKVSDPGHGAWGFRTENADDGGLPGVSINSLLTEFCDSTTFPFLVKINIEGGEKEVFERNTEWVEKIGIVIVELHDFVLPKEGTARPFLKCASALDRDFVYSGSNVFSIDNNIFN